MLPFSSFLFNLRFIYTLVAFSEITEDSTDLFVLTGIQNVDNIPLSPLLRSGAIKERLLPEKCSSRSIRGVRSKLNLNTSCIRRWRAF